MPRIKDIIPMLLPLVVIFYYCYPQALSVTGRSSIFLLGILGLALYVYHGFPFKEVIGMILGIGIMLFSFFFSSWVNMVDDPYNIGYPRSQVAWLFGAYLVAFLIFKVHKKPTFNTLLLYIAAAIGLQALAAFAMYMNEGIRDFLFSIQLQEELNAALVEEGASQRLMGYGIGFFGAGAISGVALIAISYLLMRLKLKTKEFLLLAALYAFIFYIGLFMARTTVVGMAVGLALISVLFIWDNRAQKKQLKNFAIASVFLMAGGYAFATFYFPQFSDWAFELFNNFLRTGKLQTKSSSGLEEMFIFPQDLHTLLYGRGRMEFHGTDVGYSRMLFWTGVPGTIIYYGVQFFFARMCFTKDWATNTFVIAIFIYSLALNVKGWIDLNCFLFLVFFYFMFYKYYVYMPKQYTTVRTVAGMRREALQRKRKKTKSQ
jgi:hypothetical protein